MKKHTLTKKIIRQTDTNQIKTKNKNHRRGKEQTDKGGSHVSTVKGEVVQVTFKAGRKVGAVVWWRGGKMER